MFGRFHTCYFTLHRGWMVCLLNCESSTFVLIFASLVSLSTSTGTTAINIGGLFPLISDHGNQELAAVMMALSQVNNKTDGVADALLTDFQARPPILLIILTVHSIKCLLHTLVVHQIQLIARDSKGMPHNAALQAANIVGVECYADRCLDANHKADAPIVGFLGPGSPDVVTKVQRLLQLPHVDIAQLIYSSSSPALDNAGYCTDIFPDYATTCNTCKRHLHTFARTYKCALAHLATATTEKFPLLSRLMPTDNTQPGAMLDVLTLLLNAAKVNLVAASDQTSALHARMFQAAVSVVRAWSSQSISCNRMRVEFAATSCC